MISVSWNLHVILSNRTPPTTRYRHSVVLITTIKAQCLSLHSEGIAGLKKLIYILSFIQSCYILSLNPVRELWPQQWFELFNSHTVLYVPSRQTPAYYSLA